MKQTNFLKSFFLLCALIVGSSSVRAAGTSGTINFGNGSGDLNVNSSSVNGNDSQGNTWTVTTAGTTSYTPNANYAQIGSSSKPASSITFTMTLAANQNITAFSAKFGGFSDTAGTVTLKVDNTTVGTGSLNASTDVTVTNSSSTTGKTLTVTVTGISKGVKAYFISYTYEAAKTLDHITLSGTYPTSFTEQDEFSHEGMTVTANYEDSSSKDVTSSATFTGYDMDEIGNQTVTVSYTDGNTTKTATYDITINAGEKYTVSFDPEAGTCGTASLTESAYKGGVTLPSATIEELDGWTFAGWAAASQTSTTTRPTLYKSGSTYYPTANTTLYAVYTLDGVDYEKYERATTLDQITSASQIAIVNASKILNNEFANTTAPTETEGKIDEPSSGRIWTLSGDNTEGFTLTNGGETLGTTTETFSSSTSYVVSLSSNNNKWLFVESTSGTNNFVVRNTNLNSNSLVGSLQYYSSQNKWQTYFLSSSGYAGNSSVASRIYVPVNTVFNSNPTQAVVTPVVEFNSTDAKTLYLDGTKTYTNIATVTGIDKPISYSSSDESVATVNASGVVTAVGIGTATITASVAAELGVNKAASDAYEVTVKNTTTIAGLKALYNAAQSPAKAFAADFTDAVVTYVSGTHAYIQDASGAIYASCGSSLTAGKKINGAVSGTITAPNTIDEIKTIDISAATVTEDGVIPAAAVKTLAEIKAGDYDGKLVTVNGATVKTGMDATSGGVITDDDNVTTFNIIAPNGLTLNATEEGNFTAFVSIYGGSTYRLNIYEASQFVKTRNVATAQPLAFTEDAIELDEETTAFAEFTGQAVEGAQGTVTYAITGDAIGTVNAETGVVTLNGACGTATITATAAAKEVTVAGVTTPYTETEESYTVTVNPRYSVTFSVNGIETVLRQSTSGAAIAVPTPAACGDYTFVGWNTEAVAPTDDEPSMTALGATVTPENNNGKYYAVFAKQTVGDDELVTFYSNAGTTGTDATSGVSMDATTNGNNGNSAPGFNLNKTLTMSSINLSGYKSPTSLYFDYIPGKSGGTYTTFVVKQYNSSSTLLSTTNVAGTDHTKYMKTDAISLDLSCVQIVITSSGYTSNCFIDNIEIKATRPSISYEDYRTSLPTVEVTISESKYLSFCYGSKLDFSETDVKAYKASVDGEGKVTLTKVDVVPAGEGVVLYCETPDTYSIPVTTKDASDVTGNEMVGVLVRTQVVWNPTTGIYNYILQQGQFNKATDGYLKPNRAYLSTSYDVTIPGAKALSVVFAEDETDGIRSIENSRIENSDYYNLAGQKVGADYKGIVIVNGKKYMRK